MVRRYVIYRHLGETNFLCFTREKVFTYTCVAKLLINFREGFYTGDCFTKATVKLGYSLKITS